jgi:hypothetical protein
MARQLTEKQQKLLAVLFDEAGGDLVTAKKLAGYSDASSTTEVMRGIKDEILEATQDYMARNAPRAAVAIAGGLVDPTELGIRDKLAAAKELLDRTGLVKTVKLELDLLEQARAYTRQYSYRQVANWLTKNSGREISHVGLMKRLKNERQRKNKVTSLRKWAEYAEKAINKAKELEESRTGAKTEATS